MNKILQGVELELVKPKNYLTVGEKYQVLSFDKWEVRIKDNDNDTMALEYDEIEEYFKVGEVPAELEEALVEWNDAVKELNAHVTKVNALAKGTVLSGYVSEVVLLDTPEDLDEWYESRC
ncbi:hypothetical protein AXI76_gp152 [Pseudoalteromonas phage H101]|uniref:Uncharacterized protein n=1 Tax=Pseudoalteromonas phage H101 TaxID=1654919 RepID=A0A0H4IRY0_9CAUD|nr:hypothetical protein AXI76_gp152 [Pseudoalteromonas phage H101]AKO61053.1 hypothetical protein [Pseudoalteromonas phage H101]|tara:strand:- start:14922 stop:15281 length:360 start_codon:yes stop_codon:yes gene_type:complete